MSKNKTTTQNTSGTTTQQGSAQTQANANQLWNLGLAATQGGAPVYNGQLTAGLSPDQIAAFNTISGAGGVGLPALLQGVNSATAASGYQPGTVTPGVAQTALSAGNPGIAAPTVGNVPGVSAGGIDLGALGTATPGVASTQNLTDVDLNGYLNPYTNNVINTTLAGIEQSRKGAQQQLSGQQAASGAFGDSRSGVQAALTNQLYDQNSQSTIAGLNSDNFKTAVSNAEADLARQAGVSQSNAGNATTASIAGLNARNSALGTNAQLGYNASAANASNSLAAMLANANNGLAASTANANLVQNNNQFNAGAQNAMSQFNTNNGLTAALANATNGLAANGQQLAAASTLGNLGMQQQQQVLNQANAQGAAGAVEQGTQQAGLTAAYNDWLRQQGWSDQQIQQLGSIFSQTAPATGYTGSSTGTNTNTQQGGSLVGSLLGAAGTIFAGPIGGAIGGSIGQGVTKVLGG